MLMTRKHGAFLLDDMDELRISDSITLIYHDIEPGPELELTVTQGSEKQRFASRYLITSRLLGKGGFGKVVVGMHQKSQRQLACKIINLKGLYQGSDIPSLRQPSDENTQPGIDSGTIKRWPSKVARCSREFRILKDLSHPNIISVYKVFLSPNTIYIFSELITGGDLFSYMERKGEPLSSVDAAVIILQILKAVEYLHDRDIVHRDLKPDNILLTYPEAGARIVLTDFGNARVLPEATSSNPSRRMFSNTGTLEYVAPEIHGMNKTMPPNSGYTKAVDMWSIGVVTANLLTGEAMFGAFRYDPDPAKAILARSAECDISVIDDPTYYAWSKVRDKPKDFVKNLLVLRIDDRMSVKEALNHPWFTNKYLAAEYEALYQRSIMDWQPQRKVYRLVEPIRMPSTDDRLVTQTRSSHFQPTSVQASLRDIKERFTGSQDWDLSVVYPPSEGDSLVLEHKEATFEGSSRYDQYSYDSGTQPGYEQSRDSIGASMDQRSLEQGV
ncbi:Pkinase-domain-containing protein [Bimuria novae-zelandiae CBS 107.79]|uniref:Pkinase-domain-containing protein n=1 Tax=Bimuria novae-zelandiae CBS 107.79 TaxID=1447943 RepID=A0A6A5V360_9PLEO|nr:Pkinase-domain-containing protein [Bimuria novae-zelandiae CBS 107.79]